MPPLQKIVRAVLYGIVIAAVVGILWWLVDYLNLPEPFTWVANGILAIGGAFALIGVILDLVGVQPFKKE